MRIFLTKQSIEISILCFIGNCNIKLRVVTGDDKGLCYAEVRVNELSHACMTRMCLFKVNL